MRSRRRPRRRDRRRSARPAPARQWRVDARSPDLQRERSAAASDRPEGGRRAPWARETLWAGFARRLAISLIHWLGVIEEVSDPVSRALSATSGLNPTWMWL